nr:LOW QUALITY PROTEIN: E3 ubiquitin-protein ligase RNF220-like [Penaeus vannamei]
MVEYVRLTLAILDAECGRKPRPGESWCPVCGVTLRPGELEAHLTHELDKLARLPQTRPLSQRTPTPTTLGGPHALALVVVVCIRTYQRVRAGRQMRSRSKRRRTAGGGTDGGDGDGEEWQTCPVCDAHVDADTADDMRAHIERCLRKAEVEFEDEEVDVEGDADDQYEEYEWCGQTRVRATQMLRAEGQLHALGTKVERGSEDEMVDVCDDADDAFGPRSTTTRTCCASPRPRRRPPGGPGERPPRTRRCIIRAARVWRSRSPRCRRPRPPAAPSTCEESVALGDHPGCAEEEAAGDPHSLGRSPSPRADRASHPDRKFSEGLGSTGPCTSSLPVCSNNNSNASSGGAVVEALRARVKELEEERRSGRCACRVCHGEYEKPLVSVSCWHVHCEQCWLHALAAKRLCPQCSIITSTADLRRVYL